MKALRVLLAVAVLVICGPPAQALAPPHADDRWLPAPAPPAPPQPTVQRLVCVAPVAEPVPAGPTQLDGLNLAAAWASSRGEGVRVAVIDTGVSPHRRLADLTPGGDYVGTGAGDQDCDAHGTLVAGIIAASPDPAADRFAGVAPAASLIGIRQASTVFAPAADPTRPGVGDVDTLARAVRTAADLGAAVINISAVACRPAGEALDDRALGAALAYAVTVKDAVVVAAAGNTEATGGCARQPADATWQTSAVAVSPAWYDDYVLAVGSVDPQGRPSAFTLPGPWVDVAAPGEAVVSLDPAGEALVAALPGPGGPTPIHGTSYAAPVVSGVAALLRARFPHWSARQVMARICDTARPAPGGWNPVVGHGVVDPVAALAVDELDNPGDPVAPTRVSAAESAATPTAPAETSADRSMPDRAGHTALTGAAACLVVLAVATVLRSARRGRHGVVGGGGGLPAEHRPDR